MTSGEERAGADPAPPLGTSALFLDFDGTLVELAETPDAIEVPAGLGARLDALREGMGGALCVVTGRALEAIERHMPEYRGDVIASHGVERRLAGRTESHPLAHSDEVARMQAAARDFARADDAYIVEPKPAGVVLHFRRKPALEAAARDFAEGLLKDHPSFRLQTAKMAFELKPAEVGKVVALKVLAETPPYAGRTPYYFGDDDTDEPAMEWVVEQGGRAYKVGEGESRANRRLDTVSEVHGMLGRWAGQATR